MKCLRSLCETIYQIDNKVQKKEDLVKKENIFLYLVYFNKFFYFFIISMQKKI